MKRILILSTILIITPNFLFCYQLTIASARDCDLIAQHWIFLLNTIPFENKDGEYITDYTEYVLHKNKPLCVIYHLYPKGHIVVVSCKELIPVKSFSVVSNFDSNSQGYEYSILEELKKTEEFLENYNKGDNKAVDAVLAVNKETWNKTIYFDLPTAKVQAGHITEKERNCGIQKLIFVDSLDARIDRTNASPLLKTKWGQGAPYYKKCPSLYGKKSYVGCTATAIAQVMKYYNWPSKGNNKSSYYWEKGRERLYADYSDKYDWAYMPNFTSDIDTTREKNAVSELCYEVGVAIETEYSPEGSGAYLQNAPYALMKFFRFERSLKHLYYYRGHNSYSWYNVMKRERDALRPAVLAIYSYDNEGHAVVVDGYLSSSGESKVHINMGWDGNYDAYYTLNNILSFDNYYYQHVIVDIIPDYQRIKLNRESHSFSRMEGKSNPSPKYFKIKNIKKDSLEYQLKPQKTWIKVSPRSGESTGEWDSIKVAVNITSLVEGKYSGNIKVVSRDVDNSPQYFTVNVEIKSPPIFAPNNFSGFRVENKSLLLIENINVLTWEADPKNRNIEKYRIYQEENGHFTLIGETDSGTFEYWHRKTEKTKTYHYALKAVNFKNREGNPAFLTLY